jgi:outer membrane receptor protein involved in Fe transport
LDASLNAHFTSAFDWSAGVFTGPVPSAQTINASVSYPLSRALRVQAVGSNVFNQRRYENFGGAVIGRRVMVGVTAAF